MAFGTITCNSCGWVVPLTPDNTLVFLYQRPLFGSHCPFQHILVLCQCGVPTRAFLDNQQIQQAIQADCSTALADYPDDAVIDGWYEAAGLIRPEETTVTPRMEQEINTFGDWLIAAPDEWIIAMFEEPEPPHELPERWC